MKKALIVANLAGFASFLVSDIDWLQKMGYTITFAANTNVLNWEDTRAALKQRCVEIVNVDFDSKRPFSKQNISAFIQLRKLLKAETYELIHCHTPIAGLITRIAANRFRRKGSKVIYTTHGFTFTKLSSKKSWIVFGTLEKLMSLLSDAIVTINREDYETARKMYCKQVFYIHGVGVNTDSYKNVSINKRTYRESIGVSPEDVMILSVGELSDRKNHRIVIEAIAKLPNKEKYHYVVCGNGINGGTGTQLKKLAEELGVRLNLLGFRSDIPEITACSDLGAIPSIREGLGLAGIQSLAAGVPVLGTDVQGIKDYLVDGETGFLCDANEAETFTEGILRYEKLINAQKEYMSACCKEMASRFDISVSRQEMSNIYTKILGA